MIKKLLTKSNLLILFIVIVLAVANTLSASLISHLGIKLDALNHQAISLAAQNKQLSHQVYTLSSLHYLKDYALEAGFIPHQDLLVLSLDQPLAQNTGSNQP